MTVRVMRWVIAAVFAVGFYGSATAQSLDSIRIDSAPVWSTSTRYYYTRIKVDTVTKPVPLPSVEIGVGFGAWALPADSLGRLYNASLESVVYDSHGSPRNAQILTDL